MTVSILTLLAGVATLILGAEGLVRGGSSLARRIGASDLAIGLTIVAMGTSAPELIVSLFSAWRGSPDLTVGNILGSNIANILLILGVVATLHPMELNSHLVRRDIPMAMASGLVTGALLNFAPLSGATPSQPPALTRGEGWLMLLGLVIYLWRVAATAKDSGYPPGAIHIHSAPMSWLLVLGGIAGLAIGGELTISAATALARSWGVSEAFIGLTLVAVGTSLPEFATTIISGLRGNPDIAVGNVIGSNIFNNLWILGMSATITPISYNIALNADLIISLGATLLIMVLSRGGALRLGRVIGLLLLASYASYLGYILLRG